jgi:hypothetical protein
VCLSASSLNRAVGGLLAADSDGDDRDKTTRSSKRRIVSHRVALEQTRLVKTLVQVHNHHDFLSFNGVRITKAIIALHSWDLIQYQIIFYSGEC